MHTHTHTWQVSPFLDMNRSWQLEASDPCHRISLPTGRKGYGDNTLQALKFVLAPQLRLSVTCINTCEGGAPFYATMTACPSEISEAPGGWMTPSCYFMPQRVALRIYWQVRERARARTHARTASCASRKQWRWCVCMLVGCLHAHLHADVSLLLVVCLLMYGRFSHALCG